MTEQADRRLQAAHAMINELIVQKLDLIAHVLELEEKIKKAESFHKETMIDNEPSV